MKALITGITGFAGSHLAELLLKENLEVYGIARWRSKTDNIDHIREHLRIENADIRDGYSLQKVMRKVKPDYIFHLAAQSFVLESWNSPLETLGTNILGCANLLEAVRLAGVDPTILVTGSSEEYGLVHPNETPIKETNPLRPQSPYGVSKVAEDLLSRQYHRSYEMKTIVTRAFNHTGPRRGEVFVTSSFAKQIAEIEKGKEPKIYAGDLSPKRDWTDVRDVVKAYWLVVKLCTPGEVYNICSGQAWSIREMLFTLCTLTDADVETVEDPDRMRPSDIPILLGDCSKFMEQTGWVPEISFEDTMRDLLNYWRERV